MGIQRVLDHWLDEFVRTGAREPIPTTYHVQIAPDLARALEVFAAAQNIKPETIIAESLRHYLGVDA
jgi:hypothetical protein